MMNRGKYICKELKAVRRKIAEENDIPLEIKECAYQGPCKGTCPRCEAEVRFLENSLANRLKMGKVATVAGLALGLASCGGGQPSTPLSTPPGRVDPETDLWEGEAESIPEGPETNIRVPDLGELEVVGDVMKLPPPPPPPDGELYVGEAFAPEGLEEGEEPIYDIFTVVDTEPQFPGGMDAMNKFLQDNIRYPRLALENNITGKVYVTFVVEKDGSISNPSLLRDVGGGCGQEAIRVVKMMPKWTPGMQGGKPVRVRFNLPVNFVITEDMKVRVIEGMAPIETVRRPSDDSVETMKGPNAPTQQMKVDGVKVIVK